MSTQFKASLQAKSIEDAEPSAIEALQSSKEKLGFIPNMYANMANSPGLLNTYLTGYEAFRKNSRFTPLEQEVIFLTISRSNNCQYCLAAHSYIADKMFNVPSEIILAIRNNSEIKDTKIHSLRNFTSSILESRGRPTNDEVNQLITSGYTERHILEIILAIAVKTLSNYCNHLFDTSIDDIFSSYTS